MRWYKRDPDAALAGMIGLTPEERGIYNTVIDLLYSRDGELPEDDRFFARACECRPQVWRRVRNSLLTKGKLYYRQDGKLTANRVVNELQTASKRIEIMRGLRQKQLQDQRSLAGVDARTTTTTTRKKEEEEGHPREEQQASKSGEAYAFSYGVIRLTQKDYEQWKRAFPRLDLDAELTGLSSWAGTLAAGRWFPAVSAALAKKSRAVKARADAPASGGFKWNGIEGVL